MTAYTNCRLKVDKGFALKYIHLIAMQKNEKTVDRGGTIEA